MTYFKDLRGMKVDKERKELDMRGQHYVFFQFLEYQDAGQRSDNVSVLPMCTTSTSSELFYLIIIIIIIYLFN